MYLDGFPELAYARLVRKRARGVPIRDGGRAVAIAWMADGTMYTGRYDGAIRCDRRRKSARAAWPTRSSRPTPRRFASSAATTSSAARCEGLELDVERRRAPPSSSATRRRCRCKVTLREGVDARLAGPRRDGARTSRGFDDPKILIAEIGHEAVGRRHLPTRSTRTGRSCASRRPPAAPRQRLRRGDRRHRRRPARRQRRAAGLRRGSHHTTNAPG